MRLPFFNKKSKRQERYGAGSFKHLREKPKKTRRFFMFSLNFKTFVKRVSWLRVLIVLAVIFILIFGVFVVKSDFFLLKNVELVNDVEFDVERVEEEFSNKNIFSISSNEVVNFIENNFENVETVLVRKILPDKLEIIVEFVIPILVVADFENSYIIDESFQIKDTDKLAEPLSLDNFEQGIYFGQKNLNAPRIQEVIVSSVPDEEKETFSWEDVSDEEKEEVYNRFKEQVEQKIKNFLDKTKMSLSENYTELPILIFLRYPDGNASDLILAGQFEFAHTILNEFEKRELEVASSAWVSTITLEIILSTNQRFLFGFASDLPNLESQLELLDRVLDDKGLLSYSTFDFRSNNFTLKR